LAFFAHGVVDPWPLRFETDHYTAALLIRQPLLLPSQPDLQGQKLVAPIIAVPPNLLQASAPIYRRPCGRVVPVEATIRGS